MCFALDVRTLCREFPETYEGRHIRGQSFRSGTGMAANYRAACRSRSKPEFIAKLGTAIEEGDETDFWLDFAVRAGFLKRGTEVGLRAEADELVRILVRSRMTAQENLNRLTMTAASTGAVILAGVLLYVLFELVSRA